MRGGEPLEDLITALLEHSDYEALLELVESSHAKGVDPQTTEE